ncbi:MAG: hypothetical protein QQW96_18510 [Tychonema bourrellyi B0820]|nr:hypothetical protein [Tychonema bourrellyi B0820]
MQSFLLNLRKKEEGRRKKEEGLSTLRLGSAHRLAQGNNQKEGCPTFIVIQIRKNKNVKKSGITRK